MSLVTVAEHARRPRAVALVVVLTVAVIAGLLAMHAFAGHGTAIGHSASTAHSVSTGPGASTGHGGPTVHGVAAMASSPAHRSDHDSTALSPIDAASPSADHSMAWMACVLALLGAVIVFAAGAGLRLRLARPLLLSAGPARWSLVAHPLPPPDLAVLCIRRT
ncbi:hypothetical protein NS206_16970 [Microbacterium testaceum]|uniref:hypothetical protein n=1 Tax=Microbacterium testaceum TaxID=2033 RepID=UPI000734EFB0|nr:hypothetical protein [Microbacterium testaceum]KTS55391.1 hypothetical protein NS206_16970 [Microbacterium testaceum]